MKAFQGSVDQSVIFGYFTILIGLLALTVSASGSRIIGDVGPTGYFANYELFPNFTDIVSTRNEAETRTWMAAMSIFQRLKTSTCGTEAAGRLFGTCKNLGNHTSDITRYAEQLDQVKMLYATRMSICETGAGGAHAPNVCKEAMSFSSSVDDEKTYVKHDLETSRYLKNCIGSLQKHHSSWTSYSNNLQDATALCDAPRQDVEGRRMMNMYREMLQGVFGISELLKQQLVTAGEWLTQAEVRALELEVLHSESLRNLTTKHKELQALVLQDFRAMQDRTKTASEAVGRIEANLEEMLSGAYQNITMFGFDIDALKNNLATMYVGASTEMAQYMDQQLTHVDDMHAIFHNAIASFNSSMMTTFLDEIKEARHIWQGYSLQMLNEQYQQIEIAHQLRNISAETIEHQYEVRDGARYTSEQMQIIADQISELEKPFQAMSTLFEAYQGGALHSALLELIVLSFILCSFGLTFMIPRLRHLSVILLLLYGWTQSLRILVGMLDIHARTEEMIFLTHQCIKEQPRIALGFSAFIMLWFALAVLRAQLTHMAEQEEIARLVTEENKAVFSRMAMEGKANAEDDDDNVLDSGPVISRACSAPPCL